MQNIELDDKEFLLLRSIVQEFILAHTTSIFRSDAQIILYKMDIKCVAGETVL